MDENKQPPYQKYPDMSINWDRAIHLDDVINEQLVRRLIPTILKLRQESNDPITVAINSPGGSLTSLETILGLLQGPTQFNKTGSIVTVVTNKAYSAAANLLALGNYSVALLHSNILFHDVRFGEMEDVTPSKALNAAKSLQDENDRFALKLANQVIRRLVWVYLDLSSTLENSEQEYPELYKIFKSLIPDLPPAENGASTIEIVGFAATLHSKLSLSNRSLINGVMTRLGKWIHLTRLVASYPTYRAKGSRKAGLLDGVRQLHLQLGMLAELPSSTEAELKLMITLMVAELSNSNSSFGSTIEEATRNFNLITSMSDKNHVRSAIRMMIRHQSTFFDLDVDMASLTEEKRKAAIQAGLPHAQLFWLFCVSLCHELFEGDHILTPQDCQLLGLVDEVAGGGPVESRREFEMSKEQQAELASAGKASN